MGERLFRIRFHLAFVALVTLLFGLPATPAAATDTCPNNSLENCYSYAQMQQFYNAAITYVDRFFSATYQNLPRPSHYYYLAAGTAPSTPCGPQNDRAYAYCPADHSVYLGQNQLWTFYHEAGDSAAVIGLAHEGGHHIQSIAGVPEPRTFAESIRHENQADCVAGAFVRFVIRSGWLEQDDVGDVRTLLGMIASSESPTRNHGTLAERAASMLLGLNGGVPACNAFYPATPIIGS